MPRHNTYYFGLSLSRNRSITPMVDHARDNVGCRNGSGRPRPVLVCKGGQQLGDFFHCRQASSCYSSCCSPIGCVMNVSQKNQAKLNHHRYSLLPKSGEVRTNRARTRGTWPASQTPRHPKPVSDTMTGDIYPKHPSNNKPSNRNNDLGIQHVINLAPETHHPLPLTPDQASTTRMGPYSSSLES